MLKGAGSESRAVASGLGKFHSGGVSLPSRRKLSIEVNFGSSGASEGAGTSGAGDEGLGHGDTENQRVDAAGVGDEADLNS